MYVNWAEKAFIVSIMISFYSCVILFSDSDSGSESGSESVAVKVSGSINATKVCILQILLV
jgi:hypothetical protein